MKKIALYISALVAACFTSCVSLDDAFVPANQNGKKLQILASVTDFSEINVNTKALEDEESRIHELTMFVFASDTDSTIVGKPVNLKGDNSVFMIDTQGGVLIDGNNNQISMGTNQDRLKSCSIYMVANCWDVLKDKNITKLDDLKIVDIPVSGIDIPTTGIPMMGFKSGFNLSKDRDENAQTLAEIEMDKLFAKINIRFQINADQVIHTPSFSLTEWIVNNVPTAVRLGKPANATETTPAEETAHANDVTMLTIKGGNVVSDGRTTIIHSESTTNPDYFQLTFYAPEHRVNPDLTVMNNFKNELRTGGGEGGNIENAVPESDWQRFKPKFCGGNQKPMFVTVNGAYTDHQEQVSKVTYSLYLGQNNTDDFHINRNQQLNNIITIKGLTNNKAAAENTENPYNISVDHRVEVVGTGFSIAMERETLLDSHFEVRPMDVFVSAGDRVKIIVNSDDSRNDDDWLRIEKSGSSSAHISGVGVRKYFTTNLVTETLKNSRVIEITSNDNPRIWLYFDENTDVYDKTIKDSPQHRDISITVEYYKSGNNSDTPTSRNVYTFRQMNLWRVRDITNTRYYDIEYHEEYLYNYVSNDNFGKRKDGMAWGLDGITVSSNVQAFTSNSGSTIASAVRNWILDNMKPYYDFYITADECPIPNEVEGTHYFQYNGYNFTKQLVSKAEIGERLLNSDPVSAVEYCYSKNKRTSTGVVSNLQWYLPAIDEIEQIVVGGYADFAVFQDKFYWSSQPAYLYKKWKYNSIFIGDDGGDLYEENPSYARATSVVFTGGDPNDPQNYAPEDSGDHVALVTKVQHSFLGSTEDPISGAVVNRGNGYKARNSINRVRCVRNSGLVSSLAQ